MSGLFDVSGAILDHGFENLKAAVFPIERQLRATLHEMCARPSTCWLYHHEG